jgi:hypothetical protein
LAYQQGDHSSATVLRRKLRVATAELTHAQSCADTGRIELETHNRIYTTSLRRNNTHTYQNWCQSGVSTRRTARTTVAPAHRHVGGAEVSQPAAHLCQLVRGCRDYAAGDQSFRRSREGDDDAWDYAHLFDTDEHADATAALGGMASPKPSAGNVIRLRG